MFINAKNALIDAGAHCRQMPYLVRVESRHWFNGEWEPEAQGNSVEYLAECWNDAKILWGNARLVCVSTGHVIFVG